jgi:DNA-binding NarL/FixJ family response regulator
VPDPSTPPCVLVVADTGRAGELLGALSEPLPTAVVSRIEVLASTGGDDTIDLFSANKPHVVVLAATLEAGDAGALLAALREMVPRAELGVVVVADPEGPVRSLAGATELAPDRFVPRPLNPRTLRFAVASALEAVMLVRGTIVGSGTSPGTDPSLPTVRARTESSDETRAAQRARWEALADSLVHEEVEEPAEAEPLPPPVIIRPRRQGEAPPPAWRPSATVNGDTLEPWVPPDAPTREPTLILRDPVDAAPPPSDAELQVVTSRTHTVEPPPSRTRTGDDHVNMAERGEPGAAWSDPMPLAELLDRTDRNSSNAIATPGDDDVLDELDDELLGEPGRRRPEPRLEVLDDLPDAAPASGPTAKGPESSSDGRDFARQLRAKMSMMAQRLFQGADVAAPEPVDLAPRHDHHTEIDLASLGEELPLGGGVTEIEVRAAQRSGELRDPATSPGSWDTQVRERGLPDEGEIVRGVSDAAMLLAKMFGAGATGQIRFRRSGFEKVVHVDQGRPVFASSSEPLDRMGELLVREGKITAAQYERCQTVVAESGRRMGEILVDFGYLKRRELLPAVRRHVEDIVYSLFGWDAGHYRITLDGEPCVERIRLSRHPAALILEGIRRKLDRTSLERLVGPPSTVLEVSDRERLGAVINTSDLGPDERAALSAIDGQADLATVARIAGIDLADTLPLAWGLCVLGLAVARRTDTEIPDESTALVGETDLAIDRERVRARSQLVAEADYFALLGVRRDATGFEIRRAYQAARRDFAIDSFPADLRRELAQELDDIANVLDEAYRVLRDDRLRTTYLANLIE